MTAGGEVEGRYTSGITLAASLSPHTLDITNTPNTIKTLTTLSLLHNSQEFFQLSLLVHFSLVFHYLRDTLL